MRKISIFIILAISVALAGCAAPNYNRYNPPNLAGEKQCPFGFCANPNFTPANMKNDSGRKIVRDTVAYAYNNRRGATPTYYDRSPAYYKGNRSTQSALDERAWIENERYEADVEGQRAYTKIALQRAQIDDLRELERMEIERKRENIDYFRNLGDTVLVWRDVFRGRRW